MSAGANKLAERLLRGLNRESVVSSTSVPALDPGKNIFEQTSREGEITVERKGDTKNLGVWSVFGGRNFFPCEQASNILPAGQYKGMQGYDKFYLEKQDVNLDDLIILPDTVSYAVIEEIESFWTKEDVFREFGFLWKRGVLLWGAPGSGKTVTIQIIAAEHIYRGGLVLYIDNPEIGAKALSIIRQIEPTRNLLVIMEDIDGMIQHYDEADVLAILDGELQVDNVVFLATTNYPEVLDKRITNRPSRFDLVKEIGLPTDEARKMFLEIKNPRLKDSTEELLDWVKKTKGFSVAHLKELIISVEVFGNTLEESFKRLKAMSDLPSSDKADGRGKVGF